MPKPSQSWFKRFFYNQNIKRDKSNDKYKNLLNHIVLLLKKNEKEWATKWILNAFSKAQLKITSYGISLQQVLNVLEHKGLSKFEPVVNEHLFFVKRKKIAVKIKPVVAKKVVEKKATPEKKVVAKKKTSVAKKVVEKKVTPEKKTVEKKVVAKKKATPTKAKKTDA